MARHLIESDPSIMSGDPGDPDVVFETDGGRWEDHVRVLADRIDAAECDQCGAPVGWRVVPDDRCEDADQVRFFPVVLVDDDGAEFLCDGCA